jgi:hypothetical protein
MRSMMVHKQAELLLVIFLIGILAALQLKAYMPAIVKAKILHSSGAAFQGARIDSVLYHAFHGEWPRNNREALVFGMNTSYLLNDASFKDVQLKGGAITLKFNEIYPGKIITFRPAVPVRDPFGTIIWVCGDSRRAEDWHIFGDDLTNIEDKYIHAYIK